MNEFAVVVVGWNGKERRFLTTGTYRDRQRIATKLVIMKQKREIKDWGVFPLESISLEDLEARIDLP